MSKYSSFKSHQLITEDWRKFLSESGEEWYGWQESKLGKARKNPKPEEEEKEPSSLVKTLMIRGGLTRKQAEVMAKRQVELEEAGAPEESESRLDKFINWAGPLLLQGMSGMTDEELETLNDLEVKDLIRGIAIDQTMGDF